MGISCIQVPLITLPPSPQFTVAPLLSRQMVFLPLRYFLIWWESSSPCSQVPLITLPPPPQFAVAPLLTRQMVLLRRDGDGRAPLDSIYRPQRDALVATFRRWTSRRGDTARARRPTAQDVSLPARGALSIHMHTIYPAISISIYLSNYLYTIRMYLPTYLPTYLSTYLYLSIWSFYLSIHLAIRSIYRSIYIYLYLHLSIYL